MLMEIGTKVGGWVGTDRHAVSGFTHGAGRACAGIAVHLCT
jgi:hypothetical protein